MTTKDATIILIDLEAAKATFTPRAATKGVAQSERRPLELGGTNGSLADLFPRQVEDSLWHPFASGCLQCHPSNSSQSAVCVSCIG
jgi:hypothetical protein